MVELLKLQLVASSFSNTAGHYAGNFIEKSSVNVL